MAHASAAGNPSPSSSIGKSGSLARRAGTFVLYIVPLFPFFLWIYPKILPLHAKMVLAVVNAGYRAFNVPLKIRLTEGAESLSAYLLPPAGEQLLVTAHDSMGIFLGLIVLPTLLLATPVRIRKRFEILLVGFALLFVLHVGSVGILFHELYRGHDNDNFLSSWVVLATLTSGQVGSVVLWALLTAGFWFPSSLGRVRVRGPAKVPRNAACPCGSGRKYKHCCAVGSFEVRQRS